MGDDVKQVSRGVLLFFLTGVVAMIVGGFVLVKELTKEGDSTIVGIDSSSLASDTPSDRDVWPAKDFDLMTMDGQRVTMADFEGKTVFLNIWYAACPPCIREMPAFSAFSKNQANNDVVVIAVNQGDDATVVKSFVEQYGVKDILILLDPQMTLGREYGIVAYPTTYIIDENGMVNFFKIGEMQLREMHEFLDEVRG